MKPVATDSQRNVRGIARILGARHAPCQGNLLSTRSCVSGDGLDASSHTVAVSIWVTDTQFGKSRNFDCLHVFCFGVGFVAIPQKMQDAVDQKVRHMVAE